MRRSGLPVEWSGGFSPRPQISFGLALPTGAESVAEYLDVVLRDASGLPGVGAPRGAPREGAGPSGVRDEETLEGRLSGLLPRGIDVQAVATLASWSSSLQHEVTSCSWKLEVLGLGAGELRSRVERLLAAPSVLIERERKGRAVRDDLRPSVLALEVSGPPGPPFDAADVPQGSVWLGAELATRPRGVRPGELLQGLGEGVRLVRACRTHQWIERDGARLEPLPAGSEAVGAVTAHAEGRAS